MRNRYKQPEEPEENVRQEPEKPSFSNEQKKKTEKPKANKINRGFQFVFGGNMLTRSSMIRLIPYFLLLTGLAIAYIYNNNIADKKFIQIDKIKKELIELRYEAVSSKSNLEDSLKQTLVIQKLDTLGIKESKNPPKKIFIKSENKEKE